MGRSKAPGARWQGCLEEPPEEDTRDQSREDRKADRTPGPARLTKEKEPKEQQPGADPEPEPSQNRWVNEKRNRDRQRQRIETLDRRAVASRPSATSASAMPTMNG